MLQKKHIKNPSNTLSQVAEHGALLLWEQLVKDSYLSQPRSPAQSFIKGARCNSLWNISTERVIVQKLQIGNRGPSIYSGWYVLFSYDLPKRFVYI